MERSLQLSALLRAQKWVLHPGTHGALSWISRGEDWTVNMDSMKKLTALGRKLGVEVVIENISAGHAILESVPPVSAGIASSHALRANAPRQE